jgi:hypothetical protein
MKNIRDIPFHYGAQERRENEEAEKAIEEEEPSRDEAGDAEPRPPSSF